MPKPKTPRIYKVVCNTDKYFYLKKDSYLPGVAVARSQLVNLHSSRMFDWILIKVSPRLSLRESAIAALKRCSALRFEMRSRVTGELNFDLVKVEPVNTFTPECPTCGSPGDLIGDVDRISRLEYSGLPIHYDCGRVELYETIYGDAIPIKKCPSQAREVCPKLAFDPIYYLHYLGFGEQTLPDTIQFLLWFSGRSYHLAFNRHTRKFQGLDKVPTKIMAPNRIPRLVENAEILLKCLHIEEE